MEIWDRIRSVWPWLLPLLLLVESGLLAAQAVEPGAQPAKASPAHQNDPRQNDPHRPDPLKNEESLRRDIASNPEDAAAHGALAAFYSSTGRYEEALFEWGRAAQIDPEDSRYSLSVADTLIALRRFAVAQDFLTAIAPRFGTLAYYRYDRGLVYYGLRDFASGLTEFQAALRADPSLHQAIFFEGNCLAATGELDHAAEKYQQALQASPGNPQYLFALGKVRLLQGPEHYDAAASWLSAAHQARPGDIATRFYLALAKESSGDLSAASKLLETVVAERPDELESRVALARIYRRLGDPAKSLEMSEAVRRLRAQREAPAGSKP
jgi:cytochrome c-type biogenesis protein CcmH/NrfG